MTRLITQILDSRLSARSVAAARTALQTAVDVLRAQTPGNRRMLRRLECARFESLDALRALSASKSLGGAAVSRVLLDGLWDNPAFWNGYLLVRAALGLKDAAVTGVLGEYRRADVRRTFAALGVDSIVDSAVEMKSTSVLRARAVKLLAAVKSPADLAQIELPGGFPPAGLYDEVLKRQRRGTPDIDDPLLVDAVADSIAWIEGAGRVLDRNRVDLVILSHSVGFRYGAIAWAALRRGIPVLVLVNEFGFLKFLRLSGVADFTCYPGRPTAEEFERLPANSLAALRDAGHSHMALRLKGQVDDLGTRFAFHNGSEVARGEIADRFGWDKSKPIIAVYATTWYDFPRTQGLTAYLDFYHWIEATLSVAKEFDQVNWMFKPHPAEAFYVKPRSPGLPALVQAANKPHIRIAPPEWKGRTVIEAVDGIVTCHGTVGVEAAWLGKPVLAANVGWYGHLGFVVACSDSEDYERRLRSEWWRPWNAEEASRRAALFAGWFFGGPAWQAGARLPESADRDENWPKMLQYWQERCDIVSREIATLRRWFESGHRYYSVFKMQEAEDFWDGVSPAPQVAARPETCAE